MKRDLEVRETTLDGADDERRDRAFWATIPAEERFAWVFELSRRAYELAGKLPPPGQGRPRSSARVLRPEVKR